MSSLPAGGPSPEGGAREARAPLAAVPSIRGDDPAPELLGDRYRLDHVLGHGGMAMVFAAHDTVLDRKVAIKLFGRHGTDEDGSWHERFRREARAEARISHPNVIAVHDLGEAADGRPYLVMELVDGIPLSKILADEERLDAERVATIGADVARALGAAHALGIVHRDVKPANVLIDPQGLAHLGDFGLARSLDTAQAQLTMPGTLVGSAHYVAPEQVRDGAAGPPADLYSLGAMLYHLLTGVPPFQGTGAIDIAVRRLEQPAPDLRDRLPGLDPELALLVNGLLQRTPERRPGDAGEVAERLDAIAARLRANRGAADAATVVGVPLPPPPPRPSATVAGAQALRTAAEALRPHAARLSPLARRYRPQLRALAVRLASVRREELGIGAVLAVALFAIVALAGRLPAPAPRPHPAHLVAAAPAPPHTAAPRAIPAPHRPVAAAPAVPDVRGRFVFDSARALTTRGYRVSLVVVRSDLPEGTVLGQRPAPGSGLGRGGKVVLLVAGPPG